MVRLVKPLLKAAPEACKSGLALDSQLDQGIRLEVNSHIDRMPLGDLPAT